MDGASAPKKSTTIAGAKRFHDSANTALNEKNEAKKAKRLEKVIEENEAVIEQNGED